MLKFLHSSWAFLVLLMFILTLSTYFSAYAKNKLFDFRTDFRIASFTFIVLSIQIILGLLTWFSSPFFAGLKQGHMPEYMHNAHDRLLVVEHPLMMIFAWVLTLIGFLRLKKIAASRKKYASIILWYGLAFLLILSRIPWSNWL